MRDPQNTYRFQRASCFFFLFTSIIVACHCFNVYTQFRRGKKKGGEGEGLEGAWQTFHPWHYTAFLSHCLYWTGGDSFFAYPTHIIVHRLSLRHPPAYEFKENLVSVRERASRFVSQGKSEPGGKFLVRYGVRKRGCSWWRPGGRTGKGGWFCQSMQSLCREKMEKLNSIPYFPMHDGSGRWMGAGTKSAFFTSFFPLALFSEAAKRSHGLNPLKNSV